MWKGIGKLSVYNKAINLKGLFLSLCKLRVSLDFCLFIIYFIQLFVSLFYFQCDNHEIRPGKYLGVCISVANNRLFVGSIPKNKTRESILEDFGKVTG